MQMLSENFSLEELTRSDIAQRLGIDNMPPEAMLGRLALLAATLEQVRSALGNRPVLVSSGYRCTKLNIVTPGSAPDSAHTLGYAADFHCPAFGSPLAICQLLASQQAIAFDQVIWEYESWCHFSIDPRARGLVLTKKLGQPYANGLPQESLT